MLIVKQDSMKFTYCKCKQMYDLSKEINVDCSRGVKRASVHVPFLMKQETKRFQIGERICVCFRRFDLLDKGFIARSRNI